MKINNFLHATSFILVGLLSSVSTATMAADATAAQEHQPQVLEYGLKLAEDGETYQMLMRPTVTPKVDISLTGQVTLRVPHDLKLQVTDVTDMIEGADWIESSRIDAPVENAKYDYISLSFIGLRSDSAHRYAFQGGKENVIFTFKTNKGCVSNIEIMPTDDPFNVPNNSTSTSPGNQFTNLGWGTASDNNYKGNYGDPITCKK